MIAIEIRAFPGRTEPGLTLIGPPVAPVYPSFDPPVAPIAADRNPVVPAPLADLGPVPPGTVKVTTMKTTVGAMLMAAMMAETVSAMMAKTVSAMMAKTVSAMMAETVSAMMAETVSAMMVAEVFVAMVAMRLVIVALADVAQEEADGTVAQLDRTAHAVAAMIGPGLAGKGRQQPQYRDGCNEGLGKPCHQSVSSN